MNRLEHAVLDLLHADASEWDMLMNELLLGKYEPESSVVRASGSVSFERVELVAETLGLSLERVRAIARKYR